MSTNDNRRADELNGSTQPDSNETRKREFSSKDDSDRGRPRERESLGKRKRYKMNEEEEVGESPLSLLRYAQEEQHGWAREAEEFFQACINKKSGEGKFSYDSKKKNCKIIREKLHLNISELPNKFQQNKRVFQLLQFYQHYMDECTILEEFNAPPLSTSETDTDEAAGASGECCVGKFDKRKKALEISMNIGGKPFDFTLADGRNFQIVVLFTGKSDQNEKHSYDHIVPLLDQQTSTCTDAAPAAVIRKRAEVILNAIEVSPENQPDWEKSDLMDAKQREAARELIVLTQVAEAAAPVWEEVKKMMEKFKGERKPCAIQGSIGGMDKYARVLLRRIVTQEKSPYTFTEAFDMKKGLYFINYEGGKRNMKTKLLRPENTQETYKAAEICRSLSK